jgi:glycosyltransferase involved in cell wall biosynthesis
VLLEAFAARRPVIGTNVGGISEIVQPEVNGLLFTRGDANDLARQMQRMLDEPKLLPQLAHGIPPVRTADEEVEQYLDIYARARAARQSIQIPAEGLNVSRVL